MHTHTPGVAIGKLYIYYEFVYKVHNKEKMKNKRKKYKIKTH